MRRVRPYADALEAQQIPIEVTGAGAFGESKEVREIALVLTALLDSDYNSLCFRATQVFFPRTGAWESLNKALKGDYDEGVWGHLRY